MGRFPPLASSAVASARRWRAAAIAVAVATALPSIDAVAQVRRIEPAIGARVTASDNVNLAPSDSAREGLIVELRPEVRITYQTDRLQANGLLGVTSYTRFSDRTSGSLYPNVNLFGTYEGVRDFFFVDAGVAASRQFDNPFVPQNDSGSAYSGTSYTTRVAPYIQGELANFSYLLRSETVWHGNSGVSNDFGNAFEWRVRGELATQRERLGAIYQYTRDYLRYPGDRTFVVEVGRAIGSYQVRPDLTVSVRGGYEWAVFPESSSDGAIYGAGIAWQPTPRTDVRGFWEERFFGPSWQATATHRMPWLAISASSYRQVSTAPQQHLVSLPGGSNVFLALDSILTTRIPDPIERASVVRDFMLLNGLPPFLAVPVPIRSDRVDLRIGHMASIALTGGRNTLVLDAFAVERRAITATGDPLPPSIALFTDEDQRGGALTYSRTLTRADSINATALYQTTRGVFAAANAKSEQWIYRVQWSQQIRPRTTGYVGTRYVSYDSNIFSSYNEIAVFAGLYHRF
jgi:uncharacterized protein (PEP-CTERM system associated)